MSDMKIQTRNWKYGCIEVNCSSGMEYTALYEKQYVNLFVLGMFSCF